MAANFRKILVERDQVIKTYLGRKICHKYAKFKTGLWETPLVDIKGGTFYRQYPSPSDQPHTNPPLFPNLNFRLIYRDQLDTRVPGRGRYTWCIVGPSLSGKTTFLQMLRGEHFCVPPAARKHRIDPQDIGYVGFDTAHRGGGLGEHASSYLAERYELRREKNEKTEFTVRNYILGNTELNPLLRKGLDTPEKKGDFRLLETNLLGGLLDLPMNVLSNGQLRRAAVAHGLFQRHRLLLLDEPFIGLDPPSLLNLNKVLHWFAKDSRPYNIQDISPTLVLTARPQDPIPFYVTHLAYLSTDHQVAFAGEKDAVLADLKRYVDSVQNRQCEEDPTLPVSIMRHMGTVLGEHQIEGSPLIPEAPRGLPWVSAPSAQPRDAREPLVEMNGCKVKIGRIKDHDRTVLFGNCKQDDQKERIGLYWTVRRGDRWGVFGPNGSGKTTLVSLLCSDHPQAYSLPIELFGRPRLPGPRLPGKVAEDPPLTFWDIQARIGHSSPEIQRHMPRDLSIRRVLESAWADTFRTKPVLDDWAVGQVDAALTWFAPELSPSPDSSSGSLDWADSFLFGGLSYSAQRVLLFLRAVIKHPDIVVLDEAFSGMDDKVRDKCMSWLEEGNSTCSDPGEVAKVEGLKDDQALICISHIRAEVPDCVREWMSLPGRHWQRPVRFGRLKEPLRTGDNAEWERIWDHRPLAGEGGVET